MADEPAKPVLEYQGSTLGEWATLQWFASHDEASDDMVLLTEAGIAHELVDLNQTLRRAEGTLVQLQLRVPLELDERASRVLQLIPDDLSTAAVAATDVGDHAIELIECGVVAGRWLPLVRFNTAFELVRCHRMLEQANFIQQIPRLAPSSSPMAARVTPHCFVLFVIDYQLDAARALILDDASADQDPDEPRCPRCRSWQASEYEELVEAFRRSWHGETSPPPRCICANCGHVGPRESFFPPPNQVPFARPADDPAV